MKKSTLIRSDKPHAVNMPAGSNVAQRKGPPKASAPEQPSEPPPNIQKVAPIKASKAQRTAAPSPAAKTVRAKATLTRQSEAPAKTAKPKAAPAKAAKPKPKARSTSPKSSTPVQASAPTEPIWEQNNPIKARIEQLRARNAQLAEQLQRLEKTPTARGKRP
ncbi:hypothetical protein [Limnohabitans sp. Bal53]|uniref:hypothetical protein n=1 Tax=Limnohabitans sp. Bal53 TaxID=1977910 RepID=UPI000DD1FE30|nr:hypothetical protein [Limnohabitans sp. Bal53]PUE41720.1 hypothetical protein B9Z50_08640 [Limnohabitans sp. Bal53]